MPGLGTIEGTACGIDLGWNDGQCKSMSDYFQDMAKLNDVDLPIQDENNDDSDYSDYFDYFEQFLCPFFSLFLLFCGHFH